MDQSTETLGKYGHHPDPMIDAKLSSIASRVSSPRRTAACCGRSITAQQHLKAWPSKPTSAIACKGPDIQARWVSAASSEQ